MRRLAGDAQQQLQVVLGELLDAVLRVELDDAERLALRRFASGTHITERMRKSAMLCDVAKRLSAEASSLRSASPVSRQRWTMLLLKRALASSPGRRVLITFGNQLARAGLSG